MRYNHVMKYLIVALGAEARPFLDSAPFIKRNVLPFALYEADDMLLCISGIGYENAMMATAALLGYRAPSPNDILLNYGICAAPMQYDIGELLLIHELTCNHVHLYPDMLIKHPFHEASLLSVDAPCAIPQDIPVDMEGFAIFKTASRFMQLHQMLFVKIVSDHFDPQRVTKEHTHHVIAPHIEALQMLMSHQSHAIYQPPLFNQTQRARIDALKHHFTKAQQDRLEDALHYYQLRHHEALPKFLDTFEAPQHKKARGEQFEQLINALYH